MANEKKLTLEALMEHGKATAPTFGLLLPTSLWNP